MNETRKGTAIRARVFRSLFRAERDYDVARFLLDFVLVTAQCTETIVFVHAQPKHTGHLYRAFWRAGYMQILGASIDMAMSLARTR